MQGKVKFYDQMKKFGFVVAEDGKEVFFHVSGLVDPREADRLFKEDLVEFEIGSGKKGDKAINIKKIKK